MYKNFKKQKKKSAVKFSDNTLFRAVHVETETFLVSTVLTLHTAFFRYQALLVTQADILQLLLFICPHVKFLKIME